MSKKLCSCPACKNEDPAVGGRFLHSSTVWRHRKKEQDLDINSSYNISSDITAQKDTKQSTRYIKQHDHEQEVFSSLSSSVNYNSDAPITDNLERYIIYFKEHILS